jgi:hypothetical protein
MQPRTPHHATLASLHPPTPCPGGRFSAQLLGVQETPKPATSVKLDFSSLLGPLFFTWVLQMLLPI